MIVKISELREILRQSVGKYWIIQERKIIYEALIKKNKTKSCDSSG
jgi:hypothetical protein